ncbi:MAG: ATP synthase subunit I, partial [Litorivicinaceae bacterium]
ASLVGYVVSSPLHAMSVMVGGSVAIIPQSLFGFWVFRQRGARKARAMAKSLFVGEGLKLSIVAVLFAVVWANSDYLKTEAVIAGFVITVLVGQLSPPLILVGHEQINRKQ